MARPRKPTKLLELSGAFRKDPGRRKSREREPELAKGIGDPPLWMDITAMEEWRRIVPDLEAAGVTSRVEATALAAYCQAVSRWQAAEAEIQREGITIETANGKRKHPAVAVAEASMALIRAFASEFGMTPSSRSRVQSKIAKSDEPMNEFAVI